MKYSQILSILLVSLCINVTFAQEEPVRAFPGAEGYGAFATGGRGGQVIRVTNLNSSGTGSFAHACSQNFPRIVVFDVSGVIEGNVIIQHPNITIAGETAPGAGITLKGRLWTRYSTELQNIIVRFIRIRPPAESGTQGDSVQFSRTSNFIFDHVNMSWGSDETVDLYEARNVTIQYCFIEESASNAGHPDGNFHNYGLINGPDGRYISVHHNLFAHHNHRTPAIANGPADIINNVVYNTTTGFCHHNPVNNDCFLIIGNYYKTGPTRPDMNPYWLDDETLPYDAKYYINGNYVDDPPQYEDFLDNPFTSNYSGVYLYSRNQTTVSQPCSETDVTIHTAAEAYDIVLNTAGSFPRDVVATRTVEEVRTRTGAWGRVVPADFMEGLTPTEAPPDTDGDGMPDWWEIARGHDPETPDSMEDSNGNGYVNIEEYMHYRAALLTSSNNWRGYPVLEGWVDTQSKLGMLYVAESPWIYSYPLQTWIYDPEGAEPVGSDLPTWLFINRI